MWSHQEVCHLWGLAKDVTFWAWGTAQALAWEELLGQMVAFTGEAPCNKVNWWDVGACPIKM